MPRRKIMTQTRKYLIAFFGLLLIFIWLNHKSITSAGDDGLEHFPSVSMRAVTPPSPLQRQRLLLRHFNLTARMQEIQRELNGDNEQVSERSQTPFVFWEEQHKIRPNLKPARYFVHSKKCKMPYADPQSREVLEIYNPHRLRLCTNDSDLFELRYDAESECYKLRVNETVLSQLHPNTGNNFRCNYREVTRGTKANADFESDIHPPTYFRQSCTLPKHMQGIIVECHDSRNASRILQQDAFPLVQVNNRSKPNETFERQPSVIMIGLDTMSRMNFQRTMPKTAKFVSQEGWYEMEGYNKVADNTLPNLLPVLMGHNVKQTNRICNMDISGCFDELPWIWKRYKRAGYVTALGEDTLATALFTTRQPGLEKVPVDHYLRPLLFGIDRVMSIYMRYGYHYCVGRRLSISYVYDFCLQFIGRYVEELDQPAFAFLWSQTFTHDFNFGASSLDGKFEDYLRLMESRQLFEKSIVILFSDHGARHGDLMDLSDSYLEERLPMLHIYLPPWFREAYPKYSQALYLNRNRLSSNYDLHNTLRHILQLNATTTEQLAPLATCPSSQSLLHPLARERSCEDACIPDHWCTCHEFITQTLNGEMYYLAKLVIYNINRWMLVRRFNKMCQRILLMDMDHAEKKVLFEENGKESLYGSIVVYRLRFHTFPDKGNFQTTVRYNRELNKIEDFHISDVSRLDTYKNHSYCVSDKIAKKFCFCYPKGQLNSFLGYWQNLNFTTQST